MNKPEIPKLEILKLNKNSWNIWIPISNSNTFLTDIRRMKIESHPVKNHKNMTKYYLIKNPETSRAVYPFDFPAKDLKPFLNDLLKLSEFSKKYRIWEKENND